MVDFGRILKEERIKAGLTQKELAAKIGVTNIFHVSADYLLGIDTKPTEVLDLTGLQEEDIALLRHTAETLRNKNKTGI